MWHTTLPAYIYNTALLMLMVGILASSIGIISAWIVTAYDFPGRKWLSWALVLPIISPPYIIAYIYADLLEFYGPVQSSLRSLFNWTYTDYSFPSIRNLPGAALMLSSVLYPYIYLLARASFLSQSQSQLWAARNLGLSPKAAFFRIVLPGARPAIAGGLALVLMETLADFGVADFFAIPTFSVGIFRNWLLLGDKAAALNLAGVMLFLVILLVIFEAQQRQGNVASSGRTTAQAEKMRLKGPAAFCAMLFCLLPVCIGFIIPLLRLIYHSLTFSNADAGSFVTRSNLFTYIKNSVGLALIVAIIVIGLAILLAYIKRGNVNPLKRISIRIATLGYALPGALLAVGLLAPLSILDQNLSGFLNIIGVWTGGLILTGTVIALIYALSIRFLTVAYNGIDSSFDKIPLALDFAARSLGVMAPKRIYKIYLPLLRPSLLAALILVFIDVLRELPATLILRPFNFDTLATRVYWLASDERLAEASSAALVIMLIGVIPTLYLNAFLIKKDK